MKDEQLALSPVRVPKTSELVADALRKRIVRGDLKEGQSLNSETQLMKQFAISRPTMREAVRILESESLITVSRGSRGGAVVSKPKVDVAARYAGLFLQVEGTTIGDIFFARNVIEPAAVRLLAEGPTNKILSSLREYVDNEAALLNDPESYMEQASHFGSFLIKLSGNKSLYFMANVFESILAEHSKYMVGKNFRKFSTKHAKVNIKSQTALINHIESGDTDAAANFWVLHLKNVGKVLLKGVESKAIVDIIGG